MLAPRQPPAAVPQAEQRDELLDELDRGRASAQRPDVDRRRARAGAGPTSRTGKPMSSRQRTQTHSSTCLSFALPGGRSRRTVRCSSSSAPRSVAVG